MHIGHGDLCFNNILIDPIYGKVNLIDPKGNYHKKLGFYGVVDNFYDLAKLNHSFEGLYDSVVNNLFKFVIIKDKEFRIEIFKPRNYEKMNFYFSKKILDQRISRNDLSLLTSNLFKYAATSS